MATKQKSRAPLGGASARAATAPGSTTVIVSPMRWRRTALCRCCFAAMILYTPTLSACRSTERHGSRQRIFSLDHLVGAGDQDGRNLEVERLRRLEIDGH